MPSCGHQPIARVVWPGGLDAAHSHLRRVLCLLSRFDVSMGCAVPSYAHLLPEPFLCGWITPGLRMKSRLLLLPRICWADRVLFPLQAGLHLYRTRMSSDLPGLQLLTCSVLWWSEEGGGGGQSISMSNRTMISSSSGQNPGLQPCRCLVFTETRHHPAEQSSSAAPRLRIQRSSHADASLSPSRTMIQLYSSFLSSEPRSATRVISRFHQPSSDPALRPALQLAT